VDASRILPSQLKLGTVLGRKKGEGEEEGTESRIITKLNDRVGGGVSGPLSKEAADEVLLNSRAESFWEAGLD